MKIDMNLNIQLSSKMGYPTKKEVIEWLEYVCGQESQISAGNPLVEFELSDCDIILKDIIFWR